MRHLYDDRERATRVARMISHAYDAKEIEVHDSNLHFPYAQECEHIIYITHILTRNRLWIDVSHSHGGPIECEKAITDELKNHALGTAKTPSKAPSVFPEITLYNFLECLLTPKV